MRDAILGLLLFALNSGILWYRGDYAELAVLGGVAGMFLMFKD